MAKPLASQWKSARRLHGRVAGNRGASVAVGLLVFARGVASGGLIVQTPSPPSTSRRHFPVLGWGMGNFHMAAATLFQWKRGAQVGTITPILRHADLGTPASMRLSVSADIGPSCASLRSFPSPPSREPDLAAAIFLSFLPRSDFLITP